MTSASQIRVTTDEGYTDIQLELNNLNFRVPVITSLPCATQIALASVFHRIPIQKYGENAVRTDKKYFIRSFYKIETRFDYFAS